MKHMGSGGESASNLNIDLLNASSEKSINEILCFGCMD